MSSKLATDTGTIPKSCPSRVSWEDLGERVRFVIRKLFGREFLVKEDVLAAFSGAASGQSPKFIAELLTNTVRKTFRPTNIVLVAKGDEVGERVLLAFRGGTRPVTLRQSPLQARIPFEDMLVALPLGKGEETEYLILLGELPRGSAYGFLEMGILRSLLAQAKLFYENACL